ncbi:fucolectin-4-like [Micropterus salmoides]|uniref:fucolectin-4-like n=1 Tax=Micropterus salmoides TaxID=27706 RepID=UPI0018EB7EB1|nr:fucolectin-4-like [Micropterus salmoides]
MLWSLLFISLIGSAQNDDGTALCNTQLLPLNRTKTSQKSNYTDKNQLIYSSERATDGNMTTCAITGTESDPWWRIDLLRVYNISYITIYNTVAYNTDISGAQIHIGSSSENNGITNSICKEITNFKQNEWNNFTCITTMSGRYITVFYPGNKPLILCEVMIYGTITAPSSARNFKSTAQNETSITLQWNKVNDYISFILQFNGREIDIAAPDGDGPVTYTVSSLTAGTTYTFALFSVFENVRSSGVSITAVTAKRPNYVLVMNVEFELLTQLSDSDLQSVLEEVFRQYGLSPQLSFKVLRREIRKD